MGIHVWRDVGNARSVLREDSRNVARTWVIENLPKDSWILLDDHGPHLSPDATSVRRLRKRLAELPHNEAFTAHQATRLRILEANPSPVARNIERLAHPWWLDREPRPDELASSFKHRDMGTPLVDRVPHDIDEYRKRGVRYVITNSMAQRRYYQSEKAGEAFPRWRRFYDTLRAMEPVHQVDPAEFGGKGPVITIYLIQSQ
jgi:hypothetical protein